MQLNLRRLSLPDVICSKGDGLLHRDQGQYLHEVVLHDVSDNSKLVEVTSTALSPEGLLGALVDVSLPCR